MEGDSWEGCVLVGEAGEDVEIIGEEVNTLLPSIYIHWYHSKKWEKRNILYNKYATKESIGKMTIGKIHEKLHIKFSKTNSVVFSSIF